METDAAVLEAVGDPLSIRTLTIPELRAGQVLVDVAFSGVCQSQLNEVRGRKGEDRYIPHCLGHEGSGTVVAIGDGVSKVGPGDRVVLTWIKGDGMDVPSTAYRDGDRVVNSGAISTFMRRTVTCENRVVPISEDVPLRDAALLGCAIPTGAGCVINTAKAWPGCTVAVYGLGGIGLSAVLGAGLVGAGRIIAVDLVARKLDRARACGATDAIDASGGGTLAAVLELTDGQGVDVAIEAAGVPAVAETAFRSVRAGGGICVIAGNPAHGETIAVDPMDLIRGRRIVGTWGGETRPDRDIPRYVKEIRAGNLDVSGLISHTFALAEINRALDELESGEVDRAVVDMGL